MQFCCLADLCFVRLVVALESEESLNHSDPLCLHTSNRNKHIYCVFCGADVSLQWYDMNITIRQYFQNWISQSIRWLHTDHHFPNKGLLNYGLDSSKNLLLSVKEKLIPYNVWELLSVPSLAFGANSGSTIPSFLTRQLSNSQGSRYSFLHTFLTVLQMVLFTFLSISV